jgi:outer membrane protein
MQLSIRSSIQLNKKYSITLHCISKSAYSFPLSLGTYMPIRLKAISVLVLVLSLFNAPAIRAQQLTLPELVSRVQAASPQARAALFAYKAAFYQYKSFKAGLKPQIRLSGVFPEFYRSIDRIVQPDGTFEFRERQVATTQATLALDQALPFSGGTISLLTQAQRLDDFNNRLVNYQVNPVLLQLRQPIVGFNQLKWNNKISPAEFKEAERAYVLAMEQVAASAADQFFQLLLAQTDLELAETNLAGSDTLDRIAKGRFAVGKIGEDDLLQYQLSVLNARRALAEARMETERISAVLSGQMGREDTAIILLATPQAPALPPLGQATVLQTGLANGPIASRIARQKLEADRDVAQALRATGFNADLTGTFGLTSTGINLSRSYDNPQDQQTLNLTANVPILAWGRIQAQRASALARRDQILADITQRQATYALDLRAIVRRLPLDGIRIAAADLAGQLGRKRYQITLNRFRVGKVDVTALNIAQQDKDRAVREYQATLQNYWQDYYALRVATLYDFVTGAPIAYPANFK